MVHVLQIFSRGYLALLINITQLIKLKGLGGLCLYKIKTRVFHFTIPDMKLQTSMSCLCREKNKTKCLNWFVWVEYSLQVSHWAALQGQSVGFLIMNVNVGTTSNTMVRKHTEY